MNLRSLSKPQFDACMTAADALVSGNPNRAECRQQYRDALIEFEQMLVEPEDAQAIVREAVRWVMRNEIAAVLAGIPAIETEEVQ